MANATYIDADEVIVTVGKQTLASYLAQLSLDTPIVKVFPPKTGTGKQNAKIKRDAFLKDAAWKATQYVCDVVRVAWYEQKDGKPIGEKIYGKTDKGADAYNVRLSLAPLYAKTLEDAAKAATPASAPVTS
jgi:hypothetical protein